MIYGIPLSRIYICPEHILAQTMAAISNNLERSLEIQFYKTVYQKPKRPISPYTLLAAYPSAPIPPLYPLLNHLPVQSY
jgi:hypothetical protein